MKRILINADARQTRVAVWEDGSLAELEMEAAETEQVVGNIYRGRIVKVLPGMQAAYVDIGLEKNAFLYVDEALAQEWRDGRGQTPKPRIGQLVRNGEERIVQVTKEALGGKAPRVTTNVGLPGRMLVYLPFGGKVSVSRRIQRIEERERLTALVHGILREEEGVIVRTHAEGMEEARIAAELAYLRSVWAEALNAAKGRKTPCLLHQNDDLINRTIRDLVDEEVEELVVDNPAAYRRIKQTVSALYPEAASRVTLYQGRQPLFDASGVESEIAKALRRQIWLKSGGFLVFDQTEALTVIDVNTGKFTGTASRQLEETVTKTNMEAAREIARQLRLRDIGGIILIDFIDMKSTDNQSKVLETLKAELAKDRTTTCVLGLTRLGLVEMTRKKVRRSLLETLTSACPACDGRGRVVSPHEVANRLLREIRGLVHSREMEAVLIDVPVEVETLLKEHNSRLLREWEEELGVSLFLHPSVEQRGGYSISYAGKKEEAERLYSARK